MAIFKLQPATKSYLWGGRNLIDDYGKECQEDVLAETWELSCHQDGESIICTGPESGLTLREYIERKGKDVLGANCRAFADFPVLVKLIDAEKSLSIQVHPSDEYGLEKEGQYGKTEMWYVLSAKPGAYLYFGFQQAQRPETVRARIADHTVTELLNKVEVKPGDVFFIPAGTVHAICEGITIAEIQQNSNLTYRVYDYGRKGPDGKERQLHVEKALEVMDFTPSGEQRKLPARTTEGRLSESCPEGNSQVEAGKTGECLAECQYFRVEKDELAGLVIRAAASDSFQHLLFVEGEGWLENAGERLPWKKGDSVFVEAGSGSYTIEGKGIVLVTSIP